MALCLDCEWDECVESPTVNKRGYRPKCVYKGCGKTPQTTPGLRMFRFPLDPVRRFQWIINSGLSIVPGDLKIGVEFRKKFLCQNHFPPDHFFTRKLWPGSVPLKYEKADEMGSKNFGNIENSEDNDEEADETGSKHFGNIDNSEDIDEEEIYDPLYVDPETILNDCDKEPPKIEITEEDIKDERVEPSDHGSEIPLENPDQSGQVNCQCNHSSLTSETDENRKQETDCLNDSMERSCAKIESQEGVFPHLEPLAKRVKYHEITDNESHGTLKIKDPNLQVIVTYKGLPEDGFTDSRVVDFITEVGNLISMTRYKEMPIPCFDPILSDTKHILVTAANKWSKMWLLKEIRNVSPWGQDVELYAYDPIRKFVVIVPQNSTATNEEILDLLDIQNPGLNWSERKIWERIEKPSRIGLVFLMDDRSMDKSESMDPCPFYSCTRGKFGLYLGKTTEQPLFLRLYFPTVTRFFTKSLTQTSRKQ